MNSPKLDIAQFAFLLFNLNLVEFRKLQQDQRRSEPEAAGNSGHGGEERPVLQGAERGARVAQSGDGLVDARVRGVSRAA